MKKLIIMLSLFIVGCQVDFPGISNDEIVREYHKCQDGKMKSQIVYNRLTGVPVRVICIPETECK